MYEQNSIKNNDIGQTKFLYTLQEVVSNFSFPACIRNASGNFVFSNSTFREKFLQPPIQIETWFSCQSADFQEVTSRTEIDAFLFIDSHFIVEDIFINNEFWSVCLHLYPFHNEKYVVWSFIKSVKINYLITEKNAILIRNSERIDKFRDVCNKSAKWKAFNLYSGGLSHDCIARMLNISEGTSKNYSAEVRDFFSQNDRDELIISLYRSGVFYRIYNNILQLIKI